MTFSLMALASGSLHIAGEYRAARTPSEQSLSRRWPIYICKSLTMLCIGLVVMFAVPWSSSYQGLVLLALAASLVGDVALMIPRGQGASGDWKVGYLPVGLAGFLVAHWLYVYAFWPETLIFSQTFIAFATLLLSCAAILLATLWKHFGPLLLPGLAYMASICLMVLLAFQRWEQGLPGGDWVIVGALCFAVSDTALSINRIRRPFPHAQLLILSTYYVAQLFIAHSVAA